MTIKGVFWSFLERFGTQSILLLTQIVLARLLSPKDFGLIGMIIIFVSISQVFIDSGFVNALIQKADINSSDYSTAFICNLVISIFLYLILFFSSPLIADFLNQPELKWLLRFVCLGLLFISLGFVQVAKLRKELNFKVITKATIYANIISAVVGISMALLNYGVWALAFQMVLIYFFRTLFFWIYGDWRPILIFSKKSFKALFNFGYKLLLSGIIDQAYRNIYLLIIGKLFSARDLGYYTQAHKFQEVPVQSLAVIVGSVTFPAFSKIQNEEEKLLLGVRKTLKLLVFVNFPLMLGLAAVAQPLFFYVLGEKWLSAVPYFQLLCISGMLYTLHTTNLSILQVKGRPDLFLRLEIIKKIIITIAIVIGLKWGIMGLIGGSVITSFISFFINAFYSGRLINYPIKRQLKDIYPALILSLLMVCIILGLGRLYPPSLLLFISQVLIGIISYLLMSYIAKNEACLDGIKIIKELIPVRYGRK
jgi:O-antigen/teichoic acid export membrane protein